MEYGYNYVPDEPPRNPIGCLVAVILALLFCALLGGCKAKERIVQSTVRDTVWTVQIVQGSKGDSVVYREKMVVVPHVYNVGDTNIILMDTTIVNSTERTVKEINNYYSDKGEIKHDPVQSKNKANTSSAGHVHKWRIMCIGILVGLLIAICWNYRKAIVSSIRRLANRHH